MEKLKKKSRSGGTIQPYKLAKWDVPALETLKGSLVYNLWEKRQALKREEKDFLFKELQTNSYSRKGVPRGGYISPFGDILKRFFVKVRHYGIQEVFAPDKTSIRSFYGKHEVIEIIEPNKKEGGKFQ